MRGEHRHPEVELNYLPEGSMTYLVGGQRLKVDTGRLAVFWGACPHQVIAVEGSAPFYWFTIPFAWVLQWRLPEVFMEALLQGDFLIDPATGASTAGDAGACARWFADIRSGNASQLRAAQLEMEARLNRLAHDLSKPEASGKKRAAWIATDPVSRMTEFIARHYTEAITVAEITKPTGLHPNYAMGLFRATCGMSILDYLIQHRIFHARRLLVATDMKIIDVAMESGFGSLSRFYEAFFKANACTPRAFRRQMRERD